MSEHVGLVLKRLREERKLSKSRLSREAGVSDAYIVQIEKGDRSPSEAVLRRLAHVLQVPPHRLLVPGGAYHPDTVADIEREADEVMARIGASDKEVPPDYRDRLMAQRYREIDGLQQMTATDWAIVDAGGPAAAVTLPSEVFWGWNQPLDVWPPENWDKLNDADRRMVQKLINRLTRSEESEDDPRS